MKETIIGNKFMVNTKTIGGIWHQEYFIAEKSARDYANESFNTGSVVVELYSRTRGGWNLVKSVKENQKVAEAKKKAYIYSIAPSDCEIH